MRPAQGQDTSHLVKEGGDALVLAHDLQPLARDVACRRCRGAPTFTIYNHARSRRRGKHSCALSGHSALQTYPVLGMQCKGHSWMDLLSFRSSRWCPKCRRIGSTCIPSIRACQMKKTCASSAWRVSRLARRGHDAVRPHLPIFHESCLIQWKLVKLKLEYQLCKCHLN